LIEFAVVMTGGTSAANVHSFVLFRKKAP